MEWKKEEKVVFDSSLHTPKLLNNHKTYNPPFMGRKVVVAPKEYLGNEPKGQCSKIECNSSFDKELVFKWINHRVLFRQRWGYKRNKMAVEEFKKTRRKSGCSIV